jgi:hypothetical protein
MANPPEQLRYLLCETLGQELGVVDYGSSRTHILQVEGSEVPGFGAICVEGGAWAQTFELGETGSHGVAIWNGCVSDVVVMSRWDRKVTSKVTRSGTHG